MINHQYILRDESKGVYTKCPYPRYKFPVLCKGKWVFFILSASISSQILAIKLMFTE